jgi:antitoxin YefM
MTSISLADAKAHLSDVVSRVSKHHERVTVTVHGQPSAVLLSPDDLAMLEETIAVLGDQDLMMQLAAAEADLAAGRVETHRPVAREDLEAAMRSRRTSA